MIYLDTHVIVWLYPGLTRKFVPSTQQLINDHDLLISPIVQLELHYLFEIERITVDAPTIITDLTKSVGLRICEKPFAAIVGQALTYRWTRNPFDRLLVANAAINDTVLLTKDQTILANYAHAQW